jgi:hypothetical protein
MQYGLQVVSGFLWGVGLIVAALVMKLLFHIGFCG